MMQLMKFAKAQNSSDAATIMCQKIKKNLSSVVTMCYFFMCERFKVVLKNELVERVTSF